MVAKATSVPPREVPLAGGDGRKTLEHGSVHIVKAEKYHAYGNDFLVVATSQLAEEKYAPLASAICDRQHGVGADGVIFLGEASQDTVPVRIFNQDGGEAGMSGNGCRCGCAFLHRHGRVAGPQIVLQAPSGIKRFTLLEEEPGLWRYRSGMGGPCFEPPAIPFRSNPPLDRVLRYPLEVVGTQFAITALSVGNPQCVVPVGTLPDAAEIQLWGRGLENHACFPDKTNVSFLRVLDAQNVEIRIWERGVGPTSSSGTGCCGAAVAAIQLGLVNSPVTVKTPGGSQLVEWEEGSEMFLTGEARLVAELEFYWSSCG